MELYASIGKLALKNAIGLQRNRKEIEYKTVLKLDEKASGCFECPLYSLKQVYKNHPDSEEYISACYKCTNCKTRVYSPVTEEHVRYINETHRYSTKIGYSETLKTNGLKLFLVLHLMHPNRFGHIFDLNISELKDILGCDRKTILSNLDKLKEYDYIEYIKTDRRGYVNVVLKGYEDYFKPAREGGRGYMVFSRELVTALLDIQDITTLRLFLHQLIDTENHAETTQRIFRKTYQDLLCCLPRYYKPFHIRKGLTHNIDNPIFQICIDDGVTFKLNPEYNAKKVKAQLIQDARVYITNYIDQLNDNFELINEQNLTPDSLLNEIFYKEKRPDSYLPYIVKPTHIGEVAKMAWQYPLHEILDAIDYIYVNFVLERQAIENYPGLVRTLIPEVRELHKFYRLAA